MNLLPPKRIKKIKRKRQKKNNSQTYLNPTPNRPIIIDDDVYIDTENNQSDEENDIILSNNAFDILNLTQVDDSVDDEIVKDYLENCKDDSNDESNNSVNEIQNNNKNEDEEEIDFLNSAFAKNIIKSDVGVEKEPVEMEMDLIKLLENKLSSDTSSSLSDDSDSDVEFVKVDEHILPVNKKSTKNKNKNKKNKKKNKKANKKNTKTNSNNSNKSDMLIEIDNDNNVPIINVEDAIIELDKESDLLDNQDIYTITSSTSTPSIIIDDNKSKSNINDENEGEVIEMEKSKDKSNIDSDVEVIDIKKNNKNVDIINLLESYDNKDDENENDVYLIDDDDNDDDNCSIIISDESDEFESEDSEIDNIMDMNDSIFNTKNNKKKLLIDDENLSDNFEGGDSIWDMDDNEIIEKIKNSKFKAVLNSDKDKLLRLQKKKLQKKELAQKKEYLLQKKENLKKENKRIEKVLKSKKGNKLNTSPEVFKYLKHINTTVKDFVTNGFESIPLGTLPSELRKSVGMIAIEYGVKIKTRGSGKRRITNLIRTSRSRIPDNWNTIVETVFSKTEAQRHSNMDVRKRNLDMAKRRGKYHNTGNKGKSSVNKPELGSKVGENANPISNENKGFKLLQSMGWTPGESLGTNNNQGIVNPIEVVVRDQSGLGASIFDQGYNQTTSRGLGAFNDSDDEYERDILYNSRSSSSIFSNGNKKNRKNKGKNKAYNDENFGFNRKSSKSSLRKSRIGETGGLENAPYNFVNFQKGSSLFTQSD